MWHIWEKGEVGAGFWWGNLRERDQLEEWNNEMNLKEIGW
jgi:hypothetical protein